MERAGATRGGRALRVAHAAARAAAGALRVARARAHVIIVRQARGHSAMTTMTGEWGGAGGEGEGRQAGEWGCSKEGAR